MGSQKRSSGVPNMSPISPLKKSPPTLNQTPSMMISPSKFRRNPAIPLSKQYANNMASGSTPFDLVSTVSTGSDTTSSSSDSTNVRDLRDVRDSSLVLPFQVKGVP